MTVWTPQLQDLEAVDILVVGAGSAGCCSAYAAALDGTSSVALVERYGFLGGSSTGVLDTFYGFFTPGDKPRKIVGGVPDLVADRLFEADAAMLRPNTYGAGTGVTYNPENLKLIWDELLLKAGVAIYHYALLVDVERNPDNSVASVILATKSGHFRLAAKRFIDASGDADLCYRAEIPFEKAGDIDPAQTMTTTFRMANVDFARFEAAGGKKLLADRMLLADYLPRKQGSAHAMVIEGCMASVAVRVAEEDATDFRALTVAEQIGRRQAFAFERFFREMVPGYENSRIIGLANGIGVRETRRVYGEYRLTRDDCTSLRQFEDRILLCGAPIEDHRLGQDGEEETVWAYMPKNAAYDVPYGTIVPKARDEVWVVGRCFSATHDAHASCRSMAQTMSLGQAAGLAASISLASDCGARDVPISELQDRLRRLGAVLDTPVHLADTKNWAANRVESNAIL